MAAKLTISGNLTRDPEIRGEGDKKFCTFSVAVRTRIKNDDGTYQSDFYDCSLFGNRVDYFMSRAQKGTGVLVIGDLAHRKYNRNGGGEGLSYQVTCDVAEPTTKQKEAGAARTQQTRAAAANDDNDIPF